MTLLKKIFTRIDNIEEQLGFIADGGVRLIKGDLEEKSSNGLPLVTIILAVYNGEEYLERTIKSILAQTYRNLELIIIDGGSTDSTLGIIRKYDSSINHWVSEKDRGIADAFNKGVRLARGQYINFQGDGDGFVCPTSVEDIFNQKILLDKELISARIERIDKDGNHLYFSKSLGIFKKSSLLFRMSLPHQGLFTHINFFKRVGLFNIENKFCMDYEHLLKSYLEFPEVAVSDIIVSRWRNDGLGEGKTREILSEYHKIKKQNKVANPFVLELIHRWSLFKYYMKVLLRLV